MKTIMLAILIISAFLLRLAIVVKKSCQNNTLHQVLEKEARKVLRFLLKGVIAVSLFAFAISQFVILREIGFTLIPETWISKIRALLELFLGTHSVYYSLQIVVGWILLGMEICLVLSFIGVFLVKKFFLPYISTEEKWYFDFSTKNHAEVEMPHRKRKIFFQFARIRI